MRKVGIPSVSTGVLGGLVLVLAFVLFTRIASADPCDVRVVRAPADVQAQIEKWVLAEKRCATKLEVRVIPTDGGLYIFARDNDGRTRERLVPDSTSAGVLVASWAAADGRFDERAVEPVVAPTAELSVELSWTAPTPVVDPTPVVEPTPIPVVTPSETPVVESISMPVVASARAPRQKWLVLGGMYGIGGAGAMAVRGELDLKSKGAWTLGGAFSAAQADLTIDVSYARGYLNAIDLKAIAYVQHAVDLGRWRLHSGVGAGLIATKADGVLFGSAGPNEGKAIAWPQLASVSPTAEATLYIARDIGPSWGVHFGPVITLLSQEFQLKMGESNLPGDAVYTRNMLDLMVFAAVRHRL